MAYVKVHASILDSSVWLEDDRTRIVWFTLMAMANRDGIVEASVPGLANRARVPRRSCEAALEIFMAPDPDSRTPDHDGRRLEKVPGGWRLLNYEPYREKDSIEDAKAKNAERQRRFRERHGDVTLRNVTDVTERDSNVTVTAPYASASASSDPSGTDLTPRSEDRASSAVPPNWERYKMPFDATAPFRDVFAQYPNQNGQARAASAWMAIVEAGFDGGEPALRTAILARFGVGQLKHHPYTGEAKFRPTFETYLKEFRWLDGDSRPDDARPEKLAETLIQRDERLRREAHQRKAQALDEIERKTREALGGG